MKSPIRSSWRLLPLRASCLAALTLLAFPPHQAAAARLKEPTVAAWEGYVQKVVAAVEARRKGQTTFLWADEQPAFAQRIRAGEILVSPAAREGALEVPDGLIHHWVGTVFIPGARLDGATGVLSDYDRYAEYFPPFIRAAKLTRRAPGRFWFSMRWYKKVHALSATIDTEWDSHMTQVTGARAYSLARAVSVREIRQAGGPQESALPPGEGSGFVWRACNITRFEERDGGVVLEMETLLLSRDAPVVLRWLVYPIIRGVSKDWLGTTLRQARDAVLGSVSGGSVVARGLLYEPKETRANAGR